jgi:NCAIR mutase (PurE)-related protein
MDIHQSEALAKGLLSGELSIEQFVGRITAPPTESLAQAQLDLDRIDRCGTAEVVFGEGKTIEALQSIATALQNRGQGV